MTWVDRLMNVMTLIAAVALTLAAGTAVVNVHGPLDSEMFEIQKPG